MAGGAVIGLAAHVDAGKTTLSESMLFLSGTVRRQGRVDHGDAFLDTEKMEKERGITIFSKQARMNWKKTALTLLDTPGHTDFSGETERALSVMDAAVLVVSATEGVQSHTRTLWHLLEKNAVPVVLFMNKMDRFQGDRAELLEGTKRALSDRIVDFTAEDREEAVALCDEAALDVFLREGALPEKRVRSLVRERKVFPCFFGAALRNEGVEALLDFLAGLPGEERAPEAFGARVYKIARDPQGARLTFLRITGGVLHPRDLLVRRNAEGETLWAEKAAELRLYSGARYTVTPQAEAGELCCVVGLSQSMPGDGLGTEQAGEPERTLNPCYACRLLLPAGTDLHRALSCLRTLEEEEPLLQVEYVESRREIRVHSMGEVYLEVLARQMQDRFGIPVTFGDTSVIYRETISREVEGVGHYEPLRHYAEVHLLLTPLPPGSGIEVRSAVSTDDLALNWQRLILSHLLERTHPGVLTGSPITDLRITLVAGRAHLKHTEGGDFRQATYRALRQGLMRAESVLLEPFLTLEICAPEEYTGRIMTDLSIMGGQPEGPEDAGEGLRRVWAVVPASACGSYAREVSILTRGRGQVSLAFHSYQPCPNAERVIRERGYDPERDVMNPPDSVFCAHGAGFIVPWAQVEQYMHLPSWTELRQRRQAEAAAEREIRARSVSAYHGTAEEDEALARIFEKTYGPARARELFRPVARETQPVKAPDTPAEFRDQREILLVDGYNVLFAWEEWKRLMEDNQVDAARQQLMDLMCDFSGMTGKDVILVFDAYRVKGNPGSAEKYNNIFVIYTREAQTADAFIEKTTLLARRNARVRVITSDRPEQLIALGNAAMRTSAREFHGEVAQVQGSIADYIARHNRPGSEKALEKAYKEAWKEKKARQSGL